MMASLTGNLMLGFISASRLLDRPVNMKKVELFGMEDNTSIPGILPHVVYDKVQNLAVAIHGCKINKIVINPKDKSILRIDYECSYTESFKNKILYKSKRTGNHMIYL